MNSFTVKPFENSEASLEVTLKSRVYDGVNKAPCPMMVIFPGGGYRFCSARESEPISLAFLEKGFHTCIYRYTVRNRPGQPGLGDSTLNEAAAVLRYIRAHAEEWHADPNRIFVLGFSAGGHLAASLGVHWNHPDRVPAGGAMSRPDAMILCYPVITSGEEANRPSIQNLTGIEGFSELDPLYDVSAFVDGDTPPTFLWHTWEDGAVPVSNSLAMAEALRRANRPCALHIFTKGRHGLSLGTEEVGGGPEEMKIWPELVYQWMHEMYYI